MFSFNLFKSTAKTSLKPQIEAGKQSMPKLWQELAKTKSSKAMKTTDSKVVSRLFTQLAEKTILTLATVFVSLMFTNTALASGPITFTVNTNSDDVDINPGDEICETASGSCSLRAAIQEANYYYDEVTIIFNLPTGDETIELTSNLPEVDAWNLNIDATDSTYMPYAGVPLVTIEAGNADYGLKSTDMAYGMSVKGLNIVNFQNAGIQTNSGGSIQGNWISSNTSDVTTSNTIGIETFQFAHDLRIGGAGPNEGNIIYSNGIGMSLEGSGTEVEANVIGLDTYSNLSSNNIGVLAKADSSIQILSNLISGNLLDNIRLEVQEFFEYYEISGNYIGTDLSGNSSVGDNGTGINIVGDGTSEYVGIHIGPSQYNPTEYGPNIITSDTSNAIKISNISDEIGNSITIQGNYIGLGADGETVLPAGLNSTNPFREPETYAIYATNTSKLTIGTEAGHSIAELDKTNYINADHGIYLQHGNNSIIYGNSIGYSPENTIIGTTSQNAGITLETAMNTDIKNNVIVNAYRGVNILGTGFSDSLNTTISENYIGTNQAATSVIGTTQEGIFLNINWNDIVSVLDNTIVGTKGKAGINVELAGYADLNIGGNYIGTTEHLTSNPTFGNHGHGIYIGDIFSPGQVIIGGAYNPNYIANNLQNGIAIKETGANIQVSKNSIHSNGFLGIDILNNGFSINDSPDLDGILNYPVISTFSIDPSSITIDGYIETTPSRTLDIELYFNDSSLNLNKVGQGKTYLTTLTVTTNSLGRADFSTSIPGTFDSNGEVVALAGTSASTSEFGLNSNSIVPMSLSLPAPTYSITSDTKLSVTNFNLPSDYTYAVIFQENDPSTDPFGGNFSTFLNYDGTLGLCSDSTHCLNAFQFSHSQTPFLADDLTGLLSERPSYYLQFLGYNSSLLAGKPISYSTAVPIYPDFFEITDNSYNHLSPLNPVAVGDTIYLTLSTKHLAETGPVESFRTLTATITSSSGDSEVVVLYETAPYSGLYQGMLATGPLSTNIWGDDSLDLQNGDSISASVMLDLTNIYVIDSFATAKDDGFWKLYDTSHSETTSNSELYLEFQTTGAPKMQSIGVEIWELLQEPGQYDLDFSEYQLQVDIKIEDLNALSSTPLAPSGQTGVGIGLADTHYQHASNFVPKANLLENQFQTLVFQPICDDLDHYISDYGCSGFDLSKITELSLLFAQAPMSTLKITLANLVFAEPNFKNFTTSSSAGASSTTGPGKPTTPDPEPKPSTTTGSSPSKTPPTTPEPTAPKPTTPKPGETLVFLDPKPETTTPSSSSSTSTTGSVTSEPESTEDELEEDTTEEPEELDTTELEQELEELLSQDENFSLKLAYSSGVSFPNSKFLIPGTVYSTSGAPENICFTLRGEFNFNLGCTKVEGFQENQINHFAHLNPTEVLDGEYTLQATTLINGRTLIDTIEIEIGVPSGIQFNLEEFSGTPESKLETTDNTNLEYLATIRIQDKPFAIFKIPTGKDIQVETYWQSITLNTAVLADTSTGIAVVPAPEWFEKEPNSEHKLIAYAYDINDPNKISEVITVNFKIKGKIASYLPHLIIALLLMILIAGLYLRKNLPPRDNNTFSSSDNLNQGPQPSSFTPESPSLSSFTGDQTPSATIPSSHQTPNLEHDLNSINRDTPPNEIENILNNLAGGNTPPTSNSTENSFSGTENISSSSTTSSPPPQDFIETQEIENPINFSAAGSASNSETILNSSELPNNPGNPSFNQ